MCTVYLLFNAKAKRVNIYQLKWIFRDNFTFKIYFS